METVDQNLPDAIGPNAKSVWSDAYYSRQDAYHGHSVPELARVLAALRQQEDSSIIFLAGDSSLDNKYWIEAETDRARPAVGAYGSVLVPPKMVADITYWLTKLCVENGWPCTAAINTAIEESTLRQRVSGSSSSTTLLPQDVFIHDNILPQDVLVVSVGGNDIALSPTLACCFNLFLLLYCNSLDDLTSLVASSSGAQKCWGLAYFIRLFSDDVSRYINALVAKTKPRRILVCMIYFPDERKNTKNSSWADWTLAFTRYNTQPKKLQAVITAIFELAVKRITIPGCDVVPVPLFHALDGKDSRDYVARVEPSAVGGEKMAVTLLRSVTFVAPYETDAAIRA